MKINCLCLEIIYLYAHSSRDVPSCAGAHQKISSSFLLPLLLLLFLSSSPSSSPWKKNFLYLLLWHFVAFSLSHSLTHSLYSLCLNPDKFYPLKAYIKMSSRAMRWYKHGKAYRETNQMVLKRSDENPADPADIQATVTNAIKTC